MDETTARAELPSLDIEIRHRHLPEEHTEYLSISLRATPSFGAMARHLEARNPMLPAPWMAAMALNPWAGLVRAAWVPWLAAWSRLLPQDERHHDEGAAHPEPLPGTGGDATGAHDGIERR